jgi:hypothetical protein
MRIYASSLMTEAYMVTDGEWLAQQLGFKSEASVDERVAASPLWRVAHSSRSSNAGAASVFIAFPEASRWIVAEKPGLKSTGVATILTGCNYQVPGLEELKAEVEVVDVTTEKNGKHWVRKAICVAVEGPLPPQSDLYPENMMG